MKNGEKQGQGVAYFANGDRYEGEFSKGVRDGKCVYYWKSGSRWNGLCKKGHLHGTGTFISDNGEEKEATYDNGAEVDQ